MQPEIPGAAPRTSSRAYNLLVRRNPEIRMSVTAAVVAAVLLAAAPAGHAGTDGHPSAASALSDSALGGTTRVTVTSHRLAAAATPTAAPEPVAAPTPTPTPAQPSVTPTAAPTTPAPASFASAVAAIVVGHAGHGAVAVTDLTTGATDSYEDDGHLFDTGSIVKLDILSTLLYQNQQAGKSMTASEQSLATTMIENSDNDSANSLFNIVGGVSGLTAANRVFGLTGTTVQGHWGDTTTDPDEQMKLLKQVFTDDSVLTAASRSSIQGLMSRVESDQRWGVSAAASPGTGYMLKNGWLPSSATGLWTINSIGEVTYGGHVLLIAVQTDGSKDMDTGVDFAQQIAAAAAQSLVANE